MPLDLPPRHRAAKNSSDRRRLYRLGRADTGRPDRALDPPRGTAHRQRCRAVRRVVLARSSAMACRCGAPRSTWARCIHRSAASVCAGGAISRLSRSTASCTARKRPTILLSPIRATIERGMPFRRRLDRGHARISAADEARKAGGTDYFALALNRTFRRFPVVTWATDRPERVQRRRYRRARRDQPGPRGDCRDPRRAADQRQPARHLSWAAGRHGAFSPGRSSGREGERLRAVIMMTDMRDFTGLSDRLPGEEVIELLDDYFDAIVSPIEERGARSSNSWATGCWRSFRPTTTRIFRRRACERARSGNEGSSALATSIRRAATPTAPSQNRYRSASGRGHLRQCRCRRPSRLHRDRAGGQPRLAHRGPDQAARAPDPDLARLRRICPRPLVSLGFHPVRGLIEPEEVFGLPE